MRGCRIAEDRFPASLAYFDCLRCLDAPFCRLTNAHALLSLLVAGAPLSHVRLLDVGPSAGALKQHVLGLQPLPRRRALHAAAFA